MSDPTDLLILLGAAAVSTGYAAILQRLNHRYSPDYTWLTVVIGNSMIGLVIALFCALGRVPWSAFWLLLATNLAMGLPIIAWQIGQSYARKVVREHRNGNGNGNGESHAPADKGR